MNLQEFESQISSLKNQIVQLEGQLEKIKNTAKPVSIPKEDIFLRATKIMHEMQVPPNLKGYYYIRTAIELIHKDESLLQRMTKELYPTIAKQHVTTASKVERAIRHAIENTWNKPSITEMDHVFGRSVYEEKPTNSEVLAAIVDYLKLNDRLLVCERQA